MSRILLSILIVLSYSTTICAQTISGNLSNLQEQEILLEGFNGFETYLISSTITDKDGNFELNYSQSDGGIGYLISEDENPFFVILSGEDIDIQGKALSVPESTSILEGKENQWFEQYAAEHPRREQALSAWKYLKNIYTADSLFAVQETPKLAIQNEIERIQTEDSTFIVNLPENSFVRWYLPVRKLVSSISVVAQHRPEEIPGAIEAFRNLDYTDTRLYKSGLFQDVIDSHFWLIENSGRSLDLVFEEMKISIDAMLDNLVINEQRMNEVTDYLFNLLERRSLFEASEHLALSLLNDERFNINADLAKQLETYRAMKIGNTAADIVFEGDTFAPGYNPDHAPGKLSDIDSDYTVVVFGASWCPKCREELPEIAGHYPKWKEQGVEVVFISLDEDEESFSRFVKDFPFISTSDYKKWDSRIVNDYYVFATPTTYLLNSNREILLRPKSVQQMDAWVDWYLVEGN